MAGEVGPLVLQILQPQGAGDEAGDKSATPSSEDSPDPPRAFQERSTLAHRQEEGDAFTPKIILKTQMLYRGHPSL